MQVWDQLSGKAVAAQRSAFEVLRETRLTDEKSMASQVYAILHDLIVSLELRPYQRLSEKEISEALHASKTPVREALIRLEDVGLVKIVPKSGSYVTGIAIERYTDGCFVRLHLEIGAARRAADHSDDEVGMARLDAIIAEQTEAFEAENFVGFFSLDEVLHRTIFDVAGVAGAWWIVNRSQADVDRVRHLKRIFNIRRGGDVISEHKAIVCAIRSGSPDAAEAAMLAHIGSLEAEIEELGRRPLLLEYIESLNLQKTTRRSRRT